MKKGILRRTFSLIILFSAICSYQIFSQDKLSLILQEEVAREFEVLKLQEIPVYYIAYRVDDVKNYQVNAQFGTLTNSSTNQTRSLTISIRVGTPQLDNFHKLRDKTDYTSFSRIQLSTENNPDAIKSLIWKATNDAYQEAISKFSKVKTNVAIKVEEEDKAADFTMNAPLKFEEEPLKNDYIKFDTKDWEKRLRKYSAEFLKDEDIFYGETNINYEILRKYFVSSKGDNIVQNNTSVNLYVQGFIKSKDGMEMPLYKSFFSYRPDLLPSDNDIMKQTEL